MRPLALIAFLGYIACSDCPCSKAGLMSVMIPALRPLVFVGVAALALGACGRRGPLEAPPSAVAAKGPTTTISETVPNEDSFAAQPISASPIAKAPKTTRAITIPKRDFILDPLL